MPSLEEITTAHEPSLDNYNSTPSPKGTRVLIETVTAASDSKHSFIDSSRQGSSRSVIGLGPKRTLSGRWERHGVPVGQPRKLILGAAITGAKFTPGNHTRESGETLDAILSGRHIPVGLDALEREVDAMWKGGVRYLHWHARNPLTREQSCEQALYREFGLAARRRYPGLALSYGASRNGREIREAIATRGEWERISQSGLDLHEGGADFVTTHAAAELIAILDLERQGYLRIDQTGRTEFLKPVSDYIASRTVETVSIEANSTSGGSDYGRSSPAEQLRVLAHAIAARNRLNLPQEVEWTQLPRSHALTRLLLEEFKPGLGDNGRLNVTILFGFSPKLPFPTNYESFQQAVQFARDLEQRRRFPEMHLTVTVSAAVLPQQAGKLICPLDVGPYCGSRVTPLERLVAYACQPDSGVDVLRFGLEDAPFLIELDGTVRPASNVDLMHFVLENVEKHEGVLLTDPVSIRHFITPEGRPYLR